MEVNEKEKNLRLEQIEDELKKSSTNKNLGIVFTVVGAATFLFPLSIVGIFMLVIALKKIKTLEQEKQQLKTMECSSSDVLNEDSDLKDDLKSPTKDEKDYIKESSKVIRQEKDVYKDNQELTPLKKALKDNAKTSLIIAIVGGAFLVVTFILFGLQVEIVPLITLIVGIISIIVAGMYITTIRQQIHRQHCSKCEYKFNYQNDVSWEECQRIDYGKKVVSRVNFECQCSHCGEITSFTKDFTIAEVVKDSSGNESVRYHNLNSLVEKYMK